jgi:hypothetical protein
MVREIPEYRDAVLIEVKTQVVAGIMYHLVYESKSVKHLLKVWSQPWNNKFLQITLDNGKKIVKGGTI